MMHFTKKKLFMALGVCAAACALVWAQATFSQEQPKPEPAASGPPAFPAGPAAANLPRAGASADLPLFDFPITQPPDIPPSPVGPNSAFGAMYGGWTRGLDRFGSVAADPEQLRLQREEGLLASKADQLMAGYAQADEAKRAEIQRELALILDKQFAVQQQVRGREIAAIEARVRKVRDLLEKRDASRKQIIERRIEQLIKEAEGLGWQSSWALPQPAAWPAAGAEAGGFGAKATAMPARLGVPAVPAQPRNLR